MSCCEVLCCMCTPTGRDCLGCAKTGSGKTAAFALPILHRLAEDPYGIFALVLTPTRLRGLVLHVYNAVGQCMWRAGYASVPYHKATSCTYGHM